MVAGLSSVTGYVESSVGVTPSNRNLKLDSQASELSRSEVVAG